MLDLPTVSFLKLKGKFCGYTRFGYYENFRLGKDIFTIIDGVSNGKYWTYVERYKDKPTALVKGFDPISGNAL